VSVEEKAWQKLCQVRFKETSASEPLMRCRKSKDDVKTGGFLYFRISSWRRPANCPSGVRHKGGVTLIQAFVWNVGTFASRGCNRDGGSPSEIGMQAQISNHLMLL